MINNQRPNTHNQNMQCTQFDCRKLEYPFQQQNWPLTRFVQEWEKKSCRFAENEGNRMFAWLHNKLIHVSIKRQYNITKSSEMCGSSLEDFRYSGKFLALFSITNRFPHPIQSLYLSNSRVLIELIHQSLADLFAEIKLFPNTKYFVCSTAQTWCSYWWVIWSQRKRFFWKY